MALLCSLLPQRPLATFSASCTFLTRPPLPSTVSTPAAFHKITANTIHAAPLLFKTIIPKAPDL